MIVVEVTEELRKFQLAVHQQLQGVAADFKIEDTIFLNVKSLPAVFNKMGQREENIKAPWSGGCRVAISAVRVTRGGGSSQPRIKYELHQLLIVEEHFENACVFNVEEFGK